MSLLFLTGFTVDRLSMSWPGLKGSCKEIQEEERGEARGSLCVWRENETYWYEKLLDLLQSMTHPGVGLSRRSEHLDEDVQVFVQVVVFGLAALP